MYEKPSIAIVSNIILEPYYSPLMIQYFGLNSELLFVPYGEQNRSEYKEQLYHYEMIVLWLNFEGLFPDVYNKIDSEEIAGQDVVREAVNLCESLIADMVPYRNARILLLSFEDLYRKTNVVIGHRYNSLIDKINIMLADLSETKAAFIDLKSLIAEIGISNAYNSKGKYRWNAPYSKILIENVAQEIHKQYLIEEGHTKKCLVLDCDNVLWGGILSEDGIENIKLGSSGLGRMYQDFQRLAVFMWNHGIILTVCSKNNLSDVIVMFREHNEMLLKEEHIACFQVNWEDKTGNIRKIAQKLNISLDSMVFVDDSLYEIEAVKAMLPSVVGILFSRDLEYRNFNCFHLKKDVDITAVKQRNATYRTNEFREELRVQYVDDADYIKNLDIKIDIHKMTSIEYSRVSELTQRTNKCTNGKRYTVAEIKMHVALEAVKFYSVFVSDRFADLGLVGAIEIEGDILTLFSLSCRALEIGRAHV